MLVTAFSTRISYDKLVNIGTLQQAAETGARTTLPGGGG